MTSKPELQTTGYPHIALTILSITAVLFGPQLFGEQSTPERLWHIGWCVVGYHAECDSKPLKKEISDAQ